MGYINSRDLPEKQSTSNHDHKLLNIHSPSIGNSAIPDTMHLFTTISCAFLLTAAYAHPQLDKRGLNVVCEVDAHDYDNETSGASPLISDCEIMKNNIKGGGDWKVYPDGRHHQLIQAGTCAFGVEGQGINSARFKIGNGDIYNMITNSIRDFGKDGKVGASGIIGCGLQGAEGAIDVKWNILHNQSK